MAGERFQSACLIGVNITHQLVFGMAILMVFTPLVKESLLTEQIADTDNVKAVSCCRISRGRHHKP